MAFSYANSVDGSGSVGNIPTETYINNGTSQGWTQVIDATPSISNIIPSISNIFSPSTNSDQQSQSAGLLNSITPSVLKSSFWTDLFLRSVIIILGFIFVAVGLTMFKGSSK